MDRWEPFILGVIAATLNQNETAQEIALKFVEAVPDELKPYMIICVDPQFGPLDTGARPQYKITVERMP